MTQDFFSCIGTARGCAHSQGRRVFFDSRRGPHFDAMSRSSVAAMQRSNQNMCKTHVFETHSNRNNKSRLENCDIVCERRGRESNVALLWKSGVRVTKWAIPTYNGARRAFARLSALPRWTPQPHPIQCDGFEPRRPHGGAFDSGGHSKGTDKNAVSPLAESTRSESTSCHHFVEALRRTDLIDPESWPSGLRQSCS
jgi:hypothetical protein